MNSTLPFSRADLVEIARSVLAMNPDPVPRLRLLRDVLGKSKGDPAYDDAERRLLESRWVILLAESQQSDGTWGRFHTQDTKRKQPFPTTESALQVALDSGLDAKSEVLRRLLPTLIDYVTGKYIWPDWAEKHDNPDAWPIWVRHYSAAALAQIEYYHPLLDEFWQIRARSVTAAFAGGTYDREREARILVDLLQCRMKEPVPFHVKPSLLVLSSTENRLPEELERIMLRHILESSEGIYYVHSGPLTIFPHIHDRAFWRWLNAHRLLSRFDQWREVCTGAISWIWDARAADGLWDSEAKLSRKPFTCFPLSDSWRRQVNRKIDFTTEILTLLATALPG